MEIKQKVSALISEDNNGRAIRKIIFACSDVDWAKVNRMLNDRFPVTVPRDPAIRL